MSVNGLGDSNESVVGSNSQEREFNVNGFFERISYLFRNCCCGNSQVDPLDVDSRDNEVTESFVDNNADGMKFNLDFSSLQWNVNMDKNDGSNDERNFHDPRGGISIDRQKLLMELKERYSKGDNELTEKVVDNNTNGTNFSPVNNPLSNLELAYLTGKQESRDAEDCPFKNLLKDEK